VVPSSHAKPSRSPPRLGPRKRSGPPGVARVNRIDERDEAAAREKLGDKFPRHIYHAVVCIGAFLLGREPIDAAVVDPNLGDGEAASLIGALNRRDIPFVIYPSSSSARASPWAWGIVAALSIALKLMPALEQTQSEPGSKSCVGGSIFVLGNIF
jgi:hypothetical protein